LVQEYRNKSRNVPHYMHIFFQPLLWEILEGIRENLHVDGLDNSILGAYFYLLAFLCWQWTIESSNIQSNIACLNIIINDTTVMFS